MFIDDKSKGKCPIVWTVSLWNKVLELLQIFPISSRSIIVPISLFMCIKLTSVFCCFDNRDFNRSKSGYPSLSTFKYSNFILLFEQRFIIGFKTALCSILVVIILSTPNLIHDLIIMLLDSVPPDVKKISLGFTLNVCAINFLLSSIMVFESLPKKCVEEGFPNELTRTDVISSTTLGSN